MRYGSATMERKPKLPPFADDRLVKSEQLNFRMSKALAEAIDEAAAEDGKQVSDWVRELIIRELRDRQSHGA
jgi:predicted HicB family RNase H-like nuclease